MMDPKDAEQSYLARFESQASARPPRAARSVQTWVLLALAAWALLTALMAAMQQAQPQAPPFSWPVLIGRMRELVWPTAELMLWPMLLLALYFGLMSALMPTLLRWMGYRREQQSQDAKLSTGEQEPSHGRWGMVVAATLRFSLMAFAGFAVLWAGMAGSAFLQDDDPWEALPWVTPPYLAEFLPRHPGLTVIRLDNDKLTLRGGQGQALTIDGHELVGAQANFEPCPPDIGPAQLGGIPPYPGAPCHTLLRIRRADIEQLVYAFEIADGSNATAILDHFSRWSDASASGSGMSGRAGSFQFSARSRDEAWDLSVRARDGGATSIHIRRTQPAQR